MCTIPLDGVHVCPWTLVFPSSASAGCWTSPYCCSRVFLPGLGLFPLIKRLTLPPLLLTVIEPGHIVTLHTHQAHSPRFLEVTSITLLCAEQQELKQISKIMAIGQSYRMGLLHQTVWGLVGTSYQGYPLNVGGSSTVNSFLEQERKGREWKHKKTSGTITTTRFTYRY